MRVAPYVLVACVLLSVGCRRRGPRSAVALQPVHMPPVTGYAPQTVYTALVSRARQMGYYLEVDDHTLFFSMPSLDDPRQAYIHRGPRNARAYMAGSRIDVQVFSDSSFEVRPFVHHRRRTEAEVDRVVRSFTDAIRQLQATAPAPAAVPPPPPTNAPSSGLGDPSASAASP